LWAFNRAILNLQRCIYMFNGIVIYTVPKSGTHLMSDIVSLILNPQTDIYDKKSMYKVVPHVNTFNQKYQVISTHPKYIRLNVMETANYGFLMIIRNPLDICISKYFYNEKRKARPRTIYKYVQDIIKRVSREVYSFFLMYKKLGTQAIMIKFEDLIKNKKDQIKQVYSFLKKYKNIPEPNYEDIVGKTAFEEVNKQEQQRGLYKVGAIQKHLFHRSGKVGQGRKYFTNQQLVVLLNLIPVSTRRLFPSNMYVL
jgi:hypothetical protein